MENEKTQTIDKIDGPLAIVSDRWLGHLPIVSGPIVAKKNKRRSAIVKFAVRGALTSSCSQDYAVRGAPHDLSIVNLAISSRIVFHTRAY